MAAPQQQAEVLEDRFRLDDLPAGAVEASPHCVAEAEREAERVRLEGPVAVGAGPIEGLLALPGDLVDVGWSEQECGIRKVEYLRLQALVLRSLRVLERSFERSVSRAHLSSRPTRLTEQTPRSGEA